MAGACFRREHGSERNPDHIDSSNLVSLANGHIGISGTALLSLLRAREEAITRTKYPNFHPILTMG